MERNSIHYINTAKALSTNPFWPNAISIYALSDCELRLIALHSLCTGENGCYLVGAEKGIPENLEPLQKSHPDIIVIDMEVFRGDSTQSLTKAIDALKHIAYVLILSSYLDTESAYTAIMHGASGYLLTSVSIQHCVRAFHSVFSGGTWLEEDLRKKIQNHIPNHPLEQEQHKPRLLSQRELQILQWIAKGESNKAIAKSLYLSESSVKTYWHRVLTKLNAFSKVEAVTRAIKLGLLTLEPTTDEDSFSILSPQLRATLLDNQQKALAPAPDAEFV